MCTSTCNRWNAQNGSKWRKNIYFLTRDFGGSVETKSHLFPKNLKWGAPLIIVDHSDSLAGCFCCIFPSFSTLVHWERTAGKRETCSSATVLQQMPSQLTPCILCSKIISIIPLSQSDPCILCCKNISIIQLS